MKFAILATAAAMLAATVVPGLAQAQTRAEMRHHRMVERAVRDHHVSPREARRIAERRMERRAMERRAERRMERRIAERRMERAERRHDRAVRRMHREMRRY